jgi:hypothetical protein
LVEARKEVERAIECIAQFGDAAKLRQAWGLLAAIERDAGNTAAVAVARDKAIACYIAYRRDGGENHSGSGRLAFVVTQALRDGKATEATSLLEQIAADPQAAASENKWTVTFIHALQAIVAGSRDRTLADASELSYPMAAEILLLIETLENAEKT